MNEKILIVDDEPDVCEAIGLYFSKRNYKIITANNGQEALSKAKNEKPALILLDIVMPKMGGIECLRKIRRFNKRVPIIIVTCVDKLKTALKAMKLGATDYITKPLGFDALETTISTYLFLKSVN
ncbi:MAG: response regulator [Candidatus Omnitrophica bacterium]|nr:response regulator [Candidatus Omnitrophota bacterium]